MDTAVACSGSIDKTEIQTSSPTGSTDPYEGLNRKQRRALERRAVRDRYAALQAQNKKLAAVTELTVRHYNRTKQALSLIDDALEHVLNQEIAAELEEAQGILADALAGQVVEITKPLVDFYRGERATDEMLTEELEDLKAELAAADQ